jgi:hypothetical protein
MCPIMQLEAAHKAEKLRRGYLASVLATFLWPKQEAHPQTERCWASLRGGEYPEVMSLWSDRQRVCDELSK